VAIQNINKGMLMLVVAFGWLSIAALPSYAGDGKAVYEKTCRMCHGSGMAGAPKAGDAAAWQARIEKGTEVLYSHSIDGFRDKGFMPPRGSNKKLTDEEVKAAVDYMLQLVK
jgi:cytochrome c5